jgi:hypothetical protein
MSKKPVVLTGLEVPPKAETARAGRDARVFVSYRPTMDVHDKLRALSYQTRRPIQQLVDEAVVKFLQQIEGT